jgi:hypothetical protein
MDWLVRASGIRALVNQTDIRLAIACRARSGLSGGRKSGDPQLILRGHARAHGEIGLFLLRRVWDDHGEPLGYERIMGIVEDPEHAQVFAALPETFSFKEARGITGKQCEATFQFIHKMMGLGLMRKVARGQYEKMHSGS